MNLLFVLFSSLSTFAFSPEVIICADPQEALYVELDMTAKEAKVKAVGSSEVLEVMRYLDTDSGILFFEGPVYIFDFSFRQGSQRGIGNGNLADRVRNQPMWCRFAE